MPFELQQGHEGELWRERDQNWDYSPHPSRASVLWRHFLRHLQRRVRAEMPDRRSRLPYHTSRKRQQGPSRSTERARDYSFFISGPPNRPADPVNRASSLIRRTPALQPIKRLISGYLPLWLHGDDVCTAVIESQGMAGKRQATGAKVAALWMVKVHDTPLSRCRSFDPGNATRSDDHVKVDRQVGRPELEEFLPASSDRWLVA